MDFQSAQEGWSNGKDTSRGLWRPVLRFLLWQSLGVTLVKSLSLSVLHLIACKHSGVWYTQAVKYNGTWAGWGAGCVGRRCEDWTEQPLSSAARSLSKHACCYSTHELFAIFCPKAFVLLFASLTYSTFIQTPRQASPASARRLLFEIPKLLFSIGAVHFLPVEQWDVKC